MKKKLVFILLSLLCLIVLLGTVSVTGAQGAAATKIAGHTLTLADSIAVKYAVEEKNVPAGAQTGVICWTALQESYTLENTTGQMTLKRSGSSGGYTIYSFNQLTAKMMADDIYAVSYIKIGNAVTYSAVDKYSVLQYCYSKKGSAETVEGGSTTLGELIVDILNYGSSAQKFFGYRTERLANATYYQIKVKNGTLADQAKSGLYRAGEEITLTAKLPEGATFFYWQDNAGEQVGTSAELKITVPAKDANYTAVSHILQWFGEVPATETETGVKAHYHCEECGKDFDENHDEVTDLVIPVLGPIYSEGLQFVSNGDETCYVGGMGSCTDTEVIVPSVSPDGDRVTAVGAHAFEGNTALKGVILPDGVIEIRYGAFNHCRKLTSVSIPDSIEVVGSNAFDNCVALQYQTYGDARYLGNPEAPYLVLVGATKSDITSCTVHSQTKVIASAAFYECSDLESVELPGGLTHIDNSAFSWCEKLTSITYQGTKAQWNAIAKGDDWNSGTGNYTIHCTDGDIAK